LEKKIPCDFEIEPYWEQQIPFLKLNPAGDVPVFIDTQAYPIASLMAIVEYLEESYPTPSILPDSALERAEARRLVAWFSEKMVVEAVGPLVYEKVIKRLNTKDRRGPDSTIIRQARQALYWHLEYLTWLIDQRRWLAGNTLSVADMAAAASLSCVDYLGDVPWDSYETVKDWYARLKSRPSFRSFLEDRIAGVVPPPYYADLDF